MSWTEPADGGMSLQARLERGAAGIMIIARSALSQKGSNKQKKYQCRMFHVVCLIV